MASSKQQNFEDEMNEQEYVNDEIYESGEEEELESPMPNVNKTIEDITSTIHSNTAAASASTKQKKKNSKGANGGVGRKRKVEENVGDDESNASSSGASGSGTETGGSLGKESIIK